MSTSNSFPWLQLLLTQLANQIPIIIVCLVGVILVLVRWKQVPRGAPWALGGFGLSLLLSFVMPVFYALLQTRAAQSGYQSMAIIYSVSGIITALLHALSYVFLLVGFFAGRARSVPPPTPWTGQAKV